MEAKMDSLLCAVRVGTTSSSWLHHYCNRGNKFELRAMRYIPNAAGSS